MMKLILLMLLFLLLTGCPPKTSTHWYLAECKADDDCKTLVPFESFDDCMAAAQRIFYYDAPTNTRGRFGCILVTITGGL